MKYYPHKNSIETWPGYFHRNSQANHFLIHGSTWNIPSCSVVCSTTGVNGPVPAIVNAATLQWYVEYGSRSEKISDVEVEFYCNFVPVLTAAIEMLYPRTSPFWCSSGGEFQESWRLLESSTTTVRFPGGAVGTVWMKKVAIKCTLLCDKLAGL